MRNRCSISVHSLSVTVAFFVIFQPLRLHCFFATSSGLISSGNQQIVRGTSSHSRRTMAAAADSNVVGSNALADARAYNEYSSRAVDLSSSNSYISKLDHNCGDSLLTIERSVRDIDQNKRRRFIHQILIQQPTSSNRSDDDGSNRQTVKSINLPPMELNDAVQIRVSSPSSNKVAVFRQETVNEKPRQVLEVWDNRNDGNMTGAEVLVKRIVLPEDAHGKVVSDPGGFGRPSWNLQETALVYVAERKAPKTISYFDTSTSSNVDEKGTTGTGIRGSQHTLGYGKTEKWGEKYKMSALLDIYVVHTETGRVGRVCNVPGSKTDDHSEPASTSTLGSYTLGQPVFAPTEDDDNMSIVYTGWDAGGGGEMPRRLGLVYCQQRPSKLYQSSIRELWKSISVVVEGLVAHTVEIKPDGKYKVLTPNTRINRSPRFSPCDKENGICRLIYLSSEKSFDTHFGCLELHCLDWNRRCGTIDLENCDRQVIVPEVWDPAQSSEECGMVHGLKFPGLYLLELPERCFVSSNELLLNSHWGSCLKVLRVNLSKKEVRLVAPSTDYEISGDQLLCVSGQGDAVIASKRLDETKLFYLSQEDITSSCENEPLRFLPPRIAIANFPTFSWAPKLDYTCEIHQLNTPPSIDGVDIVQPLQSVLLMPSPVTHPKPPLIVVPHGGPHSCSTTSYVPSYAYLCGYGGYAVLMVNYRGSTGFGQGLLQALPTRIGELDVADVVAATQDLASSGRIDPDRIGICGGSHGGFLVGHCTGQYPSLYRAGAMRNPVVNIPSMTTATDIADWCYVEALGGYDWRSFKPPSREELNVMYAKSPIRYFDQVDTPTLVALGLDDLRVPPSQGMEWYYSLRSKGIPTKLLAYDGNDHAIDGVVAEADHWINIKQWFDEHLLRSD